MEKLSFFSHIVYNDYVMKKSGYLLVILLIILISSAVYKYWVFVAQRNFIITSEISCDPSEESCFVWDCTPEEDPECDREPYKYISKNAKNIAVCDPYGEQECEELFCSPEEAECEITTCSEDELGDGEICAYEPEALIEDVDTGDTEADVSAGETAN